MNTRVARQLTLAGVFCLLVWVMLWHGLISPHPDLNPWLLPVIWTVPLLFPLKGIVQGNPYTHAWGNFVLMPYFLHALTLITTDEGERALAVVELLFTTLAFVGTLYYAACVVGNWASPFARREMKPTDAKRPARGVFYREGALSAGTNQPLVLREKRPAAAG